MDGFLDTNIFIWIRVCDRWDWWMKILGLGLGGGFVGF